MCIAVINAWKITDKVLVTYNLQKEDTARAIEGSAQEPLHVVGYRCYLMFHWHVYPNLLHLYKLHDNDKMQWHLMRSEMCLPLQYPANINEGMHK